AARMLAYPWPGNVRELENEIERVVVLAGDEPMIGDELLSPRIRQWEPAEETEVEPQPDSLPAAVEALERRLIGAAMPRHGGIKVKPEKRTIKVIGSAKKRISSDLIEWYGVLEARAPDRTTAYKQLRENSEKAVAYLTAAGIKPADIQPQSATFEEEFDVSYD